MSSPADQMSTGAYWETSFPIQWESNTNSQLSVTEILDRAIYNVNDNDKWTVGQAREDLQGELGLGSNLQPALHGGQHSLYLNNILEFLHCMPSQKWK